jgi:hypothetical protein
MIRPRGDIDRIKMARGELSRPDRRVTTEQ